MIDRSDELVFVRGEKLFLHPDRAIFHERTSTLIVSDLHLGKAVHFRKNGIAVPPSVLQGNLSKLDELINTYQPDELLMLGDIFHSTYNRSWEEFIKFISRHPTVRFTLVEGNHDILDEAEYVRARIESRGLVYENAPFLYIHDTLDEVPEGRCVVSGHIHPGIRLTGKGMQSVTLPCFVVSEDRIVLPAFGAFTGLARITPTKQDRIFAIGDHKVIEVGGVRLS